MARIIQRHEGHVYSVCLTPDGKHVVSGSQDKTIRITRIEDGELVRVIKGHTGFVESVCETPNGKHIVSGSEDKSIRVNRIEDGELVRKIEGHKDWIRSVCVTPDGKRIVSGSTDETIRITLNPVYLQQLHFFKRVFGQMARNHLFFFGLKEYFKENPGMFRILAPRMFNLLV